MVLGVYSSIISLQVLHCLLFVDGSCIAYIMRFPVVFSQWAVNVAVVLGLRL